MTESEMLARCDEYMEKWRGFLALKYSQDRKTRKQLAGHSDRLYVGHDLALFVEGKVAANDLTEAERKWYLDLLPHLTGGHVHYWIVRSVDELQERVDEVLCQT